MTDTIELLETIGRDASLRHASAESLEQNLFMMQASDGLRMAALSGDMRPLAVELGGGICSVVQTIQVPTQTSPFDDDDEDDPDDGDAPER